MVFRMAGGLKPLGVSGGGGGHHIADEVICCKMSSPTRLLHAATIFEAPLNHFLDVARYQRHEYHFNGRHRHYVAIPYEGRYIWGATAGMLLNLAQMLAPRPVVPAA